MLFLYEQNEHLGSHNDERKFSINEWWLSAVTEKSAERERERDRAQNESMNKIKTTTTIHVNIQYK